MRKEKRICLRFTPNTALGAALVVTSVINLIVIGAVYSAAPFTPVPSSTATPTATWTLTRVFYPTSTGTLTGTATQTPTATPSPTGTQTSTSTVTATQTPSVTPTDTPTPTVCTPPAGWVIYIVQSGDNLYRIGRATGASVEQLKRANCLISDLIYPGQRLYVPRPPDTPTDFQNPPGMSCDPPAYVSFSVTAYDPQGIISVTALLYTKPGDLIGQISLQQMGGAYSGSGSLPTPYTVVDIDHYQFRAMDRLGNTTTSRARRDRSSSCFYGGRDQDGMGETR